MVKLLKVRKFSKGSNENLMMVNAEDSPGKKIKKEITDKTILPSSQDFSAMQCVLGEEEPKVRNLLQCKKCFTSNLLTIEYNDMSMQNNNSGKCSMKRAMFCRQSNSSISSEEITMCESEEEVKVITTRSRRRYPRRNSFVDRRNSPPF